MKGMNKMFTSLSKNNLNIDHESKAKLTFTAKDNIYTKYRKTADYLSKIATFSEEDVMDSILELESLYLNTEDISFGTFDAEEEVKIDYIKFAMEHPIKVLKVVYTTPPTYGTEGSKILSENILLDLENKYQGRNGELYHIKKYPDFKFRFLSYSRTFGYAHIIRTMRDEGIDFSNIKIAHTIKKLTYGSGNKKANCLQWNLDEVIPKDKWDKLPRLLDVEEDYLNYSGARCISSSLKNENPRVDPNNGYRFYLEKYRNRSIDRNKILTELDNFIRRTYLWSLQVQYDRNQRKITRSPAWIDKKHISSSTKEAMKNSSMNKFFSHLEFDNDVDLSKVPTFSKEVCLLIDNFLPKTSHPVLRLRKLGNHKALGMYVPVLNTIVVDFRDDNDFQKQHLSTLSGIGIQSFIHEYGHYLDYKYGSSILSQRQEFSKITLKYQENITNLAKEIPLGHKLEYLLTPTEIFARAWELYVSSIGLSSPLMKTKDTYKILPEYYAFSDIKPEINSYFRNIFPDLEDKITVINNLRDDSNGTNNYENKLSYNPPLLEIQSGNIGILSFDI